MNDLLEYYNDQNGSTVSKNKFKELLIAHHYEVGNTSGITLRQPYDGVSSFRTTGSWEIGEKKKGICVKSVKIKNLDTVSSCQSHQSLSN